MNAYFQAGFTNSRNNWANASRITLSFLGYCTCHDPMPPKKNCEAHWKHITINPGYRGTAETRNVMTGEGVLFACQISFGQILKSFPVALLIGETRL